MNAFRTTNRSLPAGLPTSPPTSPAISLAAVVSAVLLAFLLASSAAGLAQADPTDATSAEAQVAVPELPFDDNPDPDQCGIPQPLGDDVRGTVDGRWEGETLFPDVHLYDSHLRSRVTGTIPTGTRVSVEMFQNNPVLDYWYVRWDGPDGTVQGWIPGPFLTVER